MEKNITLQQSDIRVINAKQVQTSALLDGMKKSRNRSDGVVTAVLFERA